MNNRSVLVPRHPQRHEFVTPDYFPLPRAAGAADDWVFLTSLYDCDDPNFVPGGCWNYAAFFVGRQSAPGAPFVADPSRDAAVDWSCMAPRAAGGVDLARAHGRTQFGCCPKTAATPSGRRVLFGWLQNLSLIHI